MYLYQAKIDKVAGVTRYWNPGEDLDAFVSREFESMVEECVDWDKLKAYVGGHLIASAQAEGVKYWDLIWEATHVAYPAAGTITPLDANGQTPTRTDHLLAQSRDRGERVVLSWNVASLGSKGIP